MRRHKWLKDDRVVLLEMSYGSLMISGGSLAVSYYQDKAGYRPLPLPHTHTHIQAVLPQTYTQTHTGQSSSGHHIFLSFTSHLAMNIHCLKINKIFQKYIRQFGLSWNEPSSFLSALRFFFWVLWCWWPFQWCLLLEYSKIPTPFDEH